MEEILKNMDSLPPSVTKESSENKEALLKARILELMGMPQSKVVTKKYEINISKTEGEPEKVENIFNIIFNKFTRNKIGSLFKFGQNEKYEGIVEIEASLGTFYSVARDSGAQGRTSSRFSPGIDSIYTYSKIIDELNNLSDRFQGSIAKSTSVSCVEVNHGSNIRKITTQIGMYNSEPEIAYEKKVGISSSVDVQPWGIRFTKSTERKIENKEGQKLFDNQRIKNNNMKVDSNLKNKNKFIQRYRSRTSFRIIGGNVEIDNRKLSGVRFDLTLVQENISKFNGRVTRLIKYEVEVENERTREQVNLENFLNAIFVVFKWSIGATLDEQITSLNERRLVVKEINKLFSYEDKYDSYKIFDRFQNKPQNIKYKNLLEPEEWAITVKTNGIRRFLFLGKKGIYLISPPYSIVKIGPGVLGLGPTFLDGEYLHQSDTLQSQPENIFFAFDTLFYDGKNVQNLSFTERQKKFDIITSEKSGIKLFENYRMLSKIFYQGGTDLYERTKKAIEQIGGDHEEYDGLIFQPVNGPYRSPADSKYLTYKWKFVELLTIDFKLSMMTEQEVEKENEEIKSLGEDIEELVYGYSFWTYVQSSNNKLEKFKGIESRPFWSYLSISENETVFTPENLFRKIVECGWDDNINGFVPVKIRNDIIQPNYIAVAKSVWQDIISPITEETITGSNLVLMRKYHNREKFSIMKSYLNEGSKILDIGSGRGSDQGKWEDAGISKVYAVEPDINNRMEFEIRLKDLELKLEDRGRSYNVDIDLLTEGVENTEYILSNVDQVDSVVSFFSLTFFMESKDKFAGLINTINNIISVGGTVIGIVMDGVLSDELISNQGKDGKFSNEVFSIEKSDPNSSEIFGNKIQINLNDEGSMVKEQTEWLFFFDVFKEALEEIGFSLQKTWILDSGVIYDGLPIPSQTFSRLNRAFVFQRNEMISQSSADSELDEELEELSKELENVLEEQEEPDLEFDQPITLAFNAPEDLQIRRVKGEIINNETGKLSDAIFSSSASYNKLKTEEERENFIEIKITKESDSGINPPMVYALSLRKNLLVVEKEKVYDSDNGITIEGKLIEKYTFIPTKKLRGNDIPKYSQTIIILKIGDDYYNLKNSSNFKNLLKIT